MKLAISGKGGVGKTTIAAGLARLYARQGRRVMAIDADADANLASALGLEPSQLDGIVPIAHMEELIAERTGAQPGSMGGYFTLNPEVDDIPDRFSREAHGVRLLVMGSVEQGGSGCLCPEGALLKSLMRYLLVQRDEVVIVDMEAGIEHLGRGTAAAVDKLIVVVEPGRRSIETALNIKQLAAEIRLRNIAIVGNKVRNQSDVEFIKSSLPGLEFLGFIPYDEAIVDADLAGRSPLEASQPAKAAVKEIYQGLLAGAGKGAGKIKVKA